MLMKVKNMILYVRVFFLKNASVPAVNDIIFYSLQGICNRNRVENNDFYGDDVLHIFLLNPLIFSAMKIRIS